MMMGILIWQIVQYNMTFVLSKSEGWLSSSNNSNARLGMISAIFWGVGSMMFISIMWRLIFPTNLLNDSKGNSKTKTTANKK